MWEQIIEKGRERGFLRYKCSLVNQYLLLERWEKECRELGIPSAYIEDLEDGSARAQVELLGGLRFTPGGFIQVTQVLKEFEVAGGCSAREVGFIGSSTNIEEPMPIILKICDEDSQEMRQKEAIASIPRPFEGLARCLDNRGLEDKIQNGEVVYIKEIVNQIDHCIVLKSDTLPLINVAINRFELPFPYEWF